MRILLALLFVGAGACATGPVVNPSPYPDATHYAPDVFTGASVTCVEQVEAAPVSAIAHCAEAVDYEAVDVCMVVVSGVRTLTEVICTVVDMSQAFHVAGKLGDTAARDRALTLDFWVRRHSIFVRGDQ